MSEEHEELVKMVDTEDVPPVGRRLLSKRPCATEVFEVEVQTEVTHPDLVSLWTLSVRKVLCGPSESRRVRGNSGQKRL